VPRLGRKANEKEVTMAVSIRPAAIAVGLCLVLAAEAHAAVFSPESFTLDNGLQVVVIPNHRTPVVNHTIYYRVGAMDEPPSKSGLAHFLEHLMFKGTDKLKPGEFSAIVARNGGQENAFTSQDYTGYYQTVAVDRLEKMMEIEADRMTHLVLTDEEIEPERNVVLEERGSRVENSPNGKLRELIGTTLFMNHPYRIPIIGWEHEIRALTRADMMAFYRTWYAPNNAVLVLSGDVTAAEVRPMVEKYYGKIPARALPARLDWKEPPQTADRRIVLKHKQVQQPTWSRRMIAPSYKTGPEADTYALQVLAEILGGGPTSRLYRSLAVEQRTAASVGAWYDPDARGPGTFGLYGSPRDGHDVGDIEKLIEAELAKLLKEGVTGAEVTQAIQRLKDAAVFARDSIDAPSRIVGSALAVGRTIADVESWPDRIGEVTVDSVNKATKALLVNKGTVTAILLPEETS
jgi:zinc protease